MHIIQVTKTIAFLMLIIAFFMIFPALVAIYYGETMEFQAFGLVISLIVVISSSLLFLFRKSKQNISIKDSFLVVFMSWFIASLFGAIPFYISLAIPSFSDAYFETISGFTTTGASILKNIEILPKSMLFWRSLTHWLGGMGIVVLTVAILPLLGVGGLQLIKAEAPWPSVDKITPRITEMAKIFWLIYLFYTVAETILLLLGDMNLFDALTHTFGTLATGGFSPKNSSIGEYSSPYIHAVVTLFMILAGMNFVLHFKILTGKTLDVLSDSEFKLYLFIFLASTGTIAWNLYSQSCYSSVGKCIQYASFQAASILTTTGYATADYEQWPALSQMVLFALMFIGGCAGSTGGGIKIIRILTLLKQSFNQMLYLLHPRGIFLLKINGKPIKKDIAYAISGFFFIYIAMLLLTAMVVASCGQDILTSISTSLATLGNIGPGFGNIGPTENYAFYPPYVKWFLSFAMMVGRLELYTVLILFTPLFWKN